MRAALGGTGDQGSLDQQVQLLGSVLRPGVAQRLELANQEGADAAAVGRGLCMCRMTGLGEGEVGREVAAAPELRVRDELVEPVEQPEDPGPGLGVTGQRFLVPREVLVRGRRRTAATRPSLPPKCS